MLLEQKTTDFWNSSHRQHDSGRWRCIGSSRSVRISFGAYGYKSDCRKKEICGC